MSEADFRPAGPDDADALMVLERDANLVALAHVFPGIDYPEDDVRERWQQLLTDPAVTVDVVGEEDRLVALVAWDDQRLRHLAVHPDRWGAGLARRAIDRAVGVTRLWVLAENHRARGLYDHLGWRASGRQQPAEFPPYPVELEYCR